MFTVYFDESYGPSDAYVVAGYVAKDEQWIEFIREWTGLLEREAITTLHRTDLECFHGEFSEARGWNPQRRAHVVMQAQGIIRRRVNIGVSSGIIKSHFDDIPDEAKEHTGKHYYTLCAQDCFRHMTNWVNQYQLEGSDRLRI